MSKPKILMVSCEGLDRGGTQAVMMNFIRNLSDLYCFDILLFTNGVRYYDKEFLSYGGKIIRIPHYNGKSQWRKKIDYYIRGIPLFFKIKRALKKNGPYHAIHCNNEYESALCLLAAKIVGIPVRISHSHSICRSSNVAAKILNGFYGKLLNKYSTQRIGCSRDACKALFGESVNSVVFNNPYDDSKFDPEKYENQINTTFTLIQVARYNHNKNQLFSFEILKILKEKKKDVLLKLVGFGKERYINLLMEKAKTLDILNNIVLLDGNSTDIPKELSKSDVFLFPSQKEGFGIALIEAQAMGLTCFVSDSVPRTTDAGGCIYLPLKDGPEKWASKILDTPCQKRKYDCSQFSSSEVAKRMALLYGGI
jgi:glycosyltransferase EpsF